jgi:hypothetical protein
MADRNFFIAVTVRFPCVALEGRDPEESSENKAMIVDAGTKQQNNLNESIDNVYSQITMVKGRLPHFEYQWRGFDSLASIIPELPMYEDQVLTGSQWRHFDIGDFSCQCHPCLHP